MASYTYTNTITQVDASTINFELISVVPPSVGMILDFSTFRNMRTSVVENMAANFPSYPFPNNYDLDSTVAGMGSVFGDSVYRYQAGFEDGGGFDYYESDDYFLVTTAIDAGIAALPITTGAEIARKAYLVNRRQAMQVTFNAGNYILTNSLIDYIEAALVALNSGIEDNPPSTIVLTTSSSITANIPIYTGLAPIYITQGGWYNVLTNTLTTDEYPYTWNFLLPVNSTNVITNPSVFPDGVYQNYSSQILIATFPPIVSFVVAPISYLLVTTTVDAQVTLYGAEHDPLNEAEAAAYAAMLALQTAIDVAYAANDYTEANALIVELQNLLAEGVSIELNAALSSVSDMVVSFDALPSGTYTGGTGTIENTLTGVDFTFDGFPTSNLDLSTILNSETLGFGQDFPDGVYQLTVNFYVDGLLFTSMCYLVVTTDWQCCIDKAVGKKCGNLNTALMQSNLTNAVRIVDVYSDVNTANALIKEGNRLCGGCGCGCK
jgi:hypothetical protein